MKLTLLRLLVCFTSVCQVSPFSFLERLEGSETPQRRGQRDTDGAVWSGKEQMLLVQLQMELQNLSAEKQSHEDLEETYKEMAQFNEDQAVKCERQIKAEFQRLQSFLQEEEQKVLSALREEKLNQTQNINLELQKVREKQISLNGNIQMLERLLQTGSSSPQPQPPAPPLQPKAGLLLDQAKLVGNLGFRVWRSMRKNISYSPVILDPNTANSWMYSSEDLTRVRHGTGPQNVPNVPERFTKYSSILGSEGFSSGSHQWDVEVGDHQDWVIGVVKESVDRKGEVKVSADYGIWALVRKGDYTNGLSGQNVRTFRVKLDYDQGVVSFYDINDVDHMTLLLSYSDNFTEKLYPLFTVANGGDAKTQEIRILQSDPVQT